MKHVILDTNAYTGLLIGNEAILSAAASAQVVYMSIFVLGELHAGFRGGSRRKQNEDDLRRFLEKPSVKILNATAETAVIFGELKNNLRLAGTPLPINDVWIAAHGVETGSVIVTLDQHFRKIAGIRLWDGA